jgi:hypothetical protein
VVCEKCKSIIVFIQSTYLSLGDAGTTGPVGPPGPSSASPTTLNAASLMSLFTTTTQMAQLFSIPSERYKNFNLSNQLDNHQNPIETATKFLDNLKRVSNEIILKSKPDGSRMHPARSCRDISDYYPEKLNGLPNYFFLLLVYFSNFSFVGLYFIDPNEGSKTDAVLVYCQLTERLTCVNSTNGLFQSNMFSQNRIHYGKRIRLMGDLLSQSEVQNFLANYSFMP